MKFSNVICLVIFLLSGLVVTAQDVNVIVGFNGPADDTVVTLRGGKVKHHLQNAVSATVHSSRLDEIANHQNVAFVIEDQPMSIVMMPPGGNGNGGGGSTQPSQALEWGVNKIDAEFVWPNGNTSNEIRVAVIDTGIDSNHPDFKKGGISSVILGPNFNNPSRSSADDNGHGTHVSGIIGARGDNNGDGAFNSSDIGVIGVAPDSVLVAVKVLNKSGSGWFSDIISGINWASNPAQGNCKVLNLSLGGSLTDPNAIALITSSVDNAVANGSVVVASAGNSNSSAPSYPAAVSSAISVSATDINNNKASFSNYGSTVDIAAPGVNIRSTYKGGSYKVLSGTSMSAPHVSGTAALVWSSGQSSTVSGVRALLMNTADPIPASSLIGNLVDAEEASLGTQNGNN
ncbi:MAG: S8 family peptidase [Planctomycetes bacterium]|nr:S8 family peptidase [Planctomycetota bacterium]